jgi:hypothetical protein
MSISRKSLVLLARHRGHPLAWFYTRRALERVAISTVEPATVDTRKLLVLAAIWETRAELFTNGHADALRTCAAELRAVIEPDDDALDRPTPTEPSRRDS